jgi:hypothetical protein
MDNTTLRYRPPGRRGLTVHLVLSLTCPGVHTAVDPAAGFEQLLVDHGAKTESMTVPIGDAPFKPATATTYGIHVVPD